MNVQVVLQGIRLERPQNVMAAGAWLTGAWVGLLPVPRTARAACRHAGLSLGMLWSILMGRGYADHLRRGGDRPLKQAIKAKRTLLSHHLQIKPGFLSGSCMIVRFMLPS